MQAGWVDQPAGLAADGARSAVSQRGGVAGVADRPVRSAGRGRALPPAADTGGGRPGRAVLADRGVGVGEAARPQPAAGAADGPGQPVAGHAHVRGPASGAEGDRGGGPAQPAPAVPPLVAAAGPTQRQPSLGAGGEGFALAAAAAVRGPVPVPAARAHATGLAGRKRRAGLAAPGAGRGGQHRRPAGDQLRGEPAEHRRRAGRRRAGRRRGRVGPQPGGQAAQHARVGHHRVHRRGDDSPGSEVSTTATCSMTCSRRQDRQLPRRAGRLTVCPAGQRTGRCGRLTAAAAPVPDAGAPARPPELAPACRCRCPPGRGAGRFPRDQPARRTGYHTARPE